MSSAADHTTVNLPGRRRRWWLHGFFLLCFVLPVAFQTGLYAATEHPVSWRSANWTSTRTLPPASADPDARILVYGARNGRWRSIFALHTWIVVKPQNGEYTRYDVTGFGQPVRVNSFAPDANWFSNPPTVIADIRGPAAAAAIPKLIAAVDNYAYAKYGDYRIWPGPNSNTFVQTVLRAAPELHIALPPTAIGKDFRADGSMFGLTPSHTGLELEIFGLIGVKAGWVEGIELNLLTLVAGIDLRRPALKLPAIGRIGVETLVAPTRA